ncbi:hypothetical protein HPB49_018979 [Dermacentor silvarum]|uniref:Uncharacterized protein n=1 Tax=Dermacentor silvarum TaxID=543639 RepID=A0ACB8CGU7_DERSI|nr:hypothetical protein HPB49_018979 [Dermacentor silvarum]
MTSPSGFPRRCSLTIFCAVLTGAERNGEDRLKQGRQPAAADDRASRTKTGSDSSPPVRGAQRDLASQTFGQIGAPVTGRWECSNRACRSLTPTTLQFTSLDSCLVSCVHVGNGRPQRRCYEGALFATCSWQDAAETWWHFDGSVCAPWNFPLGNCPLQDGRVFRSLRECDAACVHRERDDSDEQRRWDAPDAGTCAPRQIRHPYFADMHADGPARCVVASSGDLITRRCLVGPNRFDSMASCKRACL